MKRHYRKQISAIRGGAKARLLDAKRSEAGVASVPILLVLLLLTVAIGVEITSIVVTQSLISKGQNVSSQAFRYAETGGRDALIRIARDKTYTCASTDCYTIEFVMDGCTNNNGCARVEVSADPGTSMNPKIIISEGQVGGAVRRVQIDVVYDGSGDGRIVSTTWKELTD